MPAQQKKLRFRPSDNSLPPVVVRGIRVAPHEDFYHTVLTAPWWQFFLGAGIVFGGLNLLFAGLYYLDEGSVGNLPPGGRLENLFYFSVQTMATIGYGGMAPADRFGNVLTVLESIVGILLSALLTGLTFAKFSKPTARVLFPDKLVVSSRNGVPHLMIRMANWRRNQVNEATLRVMLLRVERTTEGEVLRVPVDLPLVRSSTQLFWLTWTAMHRIDTSSPFHGPDALAILEAEGAQLFLTLHGHDVTIAQAITATARYSLEDIVWGAHYADVISGTGDLRQIDYTRFNELITETPPTT